MSIFPPLFIEVPGVLTALYTIVGAKKPMTTRSTGSDAALDANAVSSFRPIIYRIDWVGVRRGERRVTHSLTEKQCREREGEGGGGKRGGQEESDREGEGERHGSNNVNAMLRQCYLHKCISLSFPSLFFLSLSFPFPLLPTVALATAQKIKTRGFLAPPLFIPGRCGRRT